MKKQNGITVVTLVVAVSILIIISSMLIYNARNGIKMRTLKLMQNDIEILEDKIAAYYIKYGALPVVIQYKGDIYFEPQPNDGFEYYIIDLAALEGITLNYGLDFEKIAVENDTKEYDDVYIINQQSHHIYYPKGIQFEGVMYYTNTEDDEIYTKDIEYIGEIYTEEMIGKTINYTSNIALPEGTEWIVLGEDEDGSIMLTTSKPIENGFTVNATAEAWLSYEEDIKEACSVYGATVQRKEVKARSITLEDVNRVTGFKELDFNTYTFGDILDYANKKVDYYHPDATSDNFWSKEETKYKNDSYNYYIDTSDNSVKYAYESNSWSSENYTVSTLKNMDIILGESSDYMYLLGSRSVFVDDFNAVFGVASVNGGGVDSDYNYLCYSSSDNFNDYGNSDVASVRPIINLPYDIMVEKVNEEWMIIE